MNRYAITEKAGRFVAGHTNTGLGTILRLTPKQAEHELRLGTLRALDDAPTALEEEPGQDVIQPQPDFVPPDLSDMTVRALTDFAAARGITLAAGLRKAEIIDAIEAALSAK